MVMDEILDKLILLGFCFVLMLSSTGTSNPVVALLAAITVASLGIFIENKKLLLAIFAAVFLLSLKEYGMFFFFAVFLYDMVCQNMYAAAVPFLLLFLIRLPKDPQQIVLWLSISLLALVLVKKTKERHSLREKLIQTRDQGEELNLMLQEKNKHLLEKQEYEIHLATFRERNRIAREIHDNVGHLLSRSLLMTGALLAVTKEEEVKGQLVRMKETLDQAMSSIRESVHGLYEDSIDLRHSIEELAESLRQRYEVKMEYDMSDFASSRVKYCLLATAKEAASNILKHSNGDQVRMSFIEHPAFYQLLIEDNGTDQKKEWDSGIGLKSMKERAQLLGGTFRVYTQSGFRIFMTIPKTEENLCGQ